MTAGFFQKWGVVGTYAFLFVCIAGSALGVYLTGTGFVAKLRFGRITVRVLGRVDETVTRRKNPFKFWFMMSQVLLPLLLSLGSFGFMLYLLFDAVAHRP